MSLPAITLPRLDRPASAAAGGSGRDTGPLARGGLALLALTLASAALLSRIAQTRRGTARG